MTLHPYLPTIPGSIYQFDEYTINSHGGYVLDQSNRNFLTIWNRWEYTRFNRSIFMSVEEHNVPFYGKRYGGQEYKTSRIYVDQYYVNQYFSTPLGGNQVSNSSFLWGLGHAVNQLSDRKYIGECGWMLSLFCPGLCKITFNPVEREILKYPVRSVDIDEGGHLKVVNCFPVGLIYKTLCHYLNWPVVSSRFSDVWRTALIEVDSQGEFGNHVYNYWYAKDIGLVYRIQLERTDNLIERNAKGKLWILRTYTIPDQIAT